MHKLKEILILFLFLATTHVFAAASFNGATVNSAQTICSGTAPAKLTLSIATCINPTAYTITAYEWQASNDNITWAKAVGGTGVTTAAYTPVALTASKFYRCKITVSGVCAGIPSPYYTASVKITVNAATAITTHPSNQTVCAGSSATFSVAATGNNLTYQWLSSSTSNGTFNNIQGATNASYSIVGSSSNNGFYYKCRLSGSCGAIITSNAASLTVNNATSISIHPYTQNICLGGNATFTIIASGSNLTYQWQKCITSSGTYSNISGATTASYVFTPSLSDNGYYYKCKVTGSCGASVYSNAMQLNVGTPASITTQAIAQTVLLTRQASFVIEASGTGLSYQWQKCATASGSFSNISGATSANYAFTPSIADNGFFYRCQITASCGSVATSEAKLLRVLIPFSGTLTLTQSNLTSSVTRAYDRLDYSSLSYALQKAKLNVLMDLGDNYSLGEAPNYTASLLITVRGYTSSGLATSSKTQTITLNGTRTSIETDKLAIIDLNPLLADDSSSNAYSDIDFYSIAFELAAGAPSSFRVRTWLDEDYTANVNSGLYTAASMLTLNAVTLSGNRANFSWTSAVTDFIDDYQIQVLRLYNQDAAKTTATNITVNAIDWDKALTLEVKNQTSIALEMVEGTGYYVWRVRPIGDYYSGGIGDSRNWGVWSAHNLAAQGSSYSVSSTSVLPKYVFYNTQLDNDKNWIYNRTFTENNKIAEAISYGSPLGMLKQSQRKLAEVDSVIMGQTAYDYTGRPAIQTLAAPVNQNDFSYKNRLIKDENPADGNDLYGPEDFDSEERTQFDDDISTVPIWENPLPMYGPIADYFSDKNPDVNIPNANNFPYSKTNYHQDGRVKKQSLFGDEHRMGLYDTTYNSGGMQRTVRTYYSAVQDTEIMIVFGNETPLDTTIYKVITVDPNENPSVEYKTIGGRTLATAYLNTGPHELLDDVWEDPSIRIHKKIQGSYQPDPYTIVREQSIAFAEPTVRVNLHYLMRPDDFSGECISYCSTCDYIINLYVIREETDEVKWDTTYILGANSCNSLSDLTKEKSDLLLSDPGVYRFGRRISVNNIYEGEERFSDYHADSIGTAMDSTVLIQFDEFKEYLEGDDASLDDLNNRLDDLAGVVTTNASSHLSAIASSTTSNSLSLSATALSHVFNQNEGWDVSYSEDNDQYTIVSPEGCCSVTVPKVTCDEDLCDQLWVPSHTSVLNEDWEDSLFNTYGGYYDFESILFDANRGMRAPSSNGSPQDQLSTYFYDKYGNYIYPKNVIETATATLNIEEQESSYLSMSSNKAFMSSYDYATLDNAHFVSNDYPNSSGYRGSLDDDFIVIQLTVNNEIYETTIQINYTHDSQISPNGVTYYFDYCSLSDATSQVESAIERLITFSGLSDFLTVSSTIGSSSSTFTLTATLTTQSVNLNVTSYGQSNLRETSYHINERDQNVQDISITPVRTNELFTSYTDFANTSTNGLFPWGNGALNTMCMHMLQDEVGDSAYSCADLLTATTQFANDWEDLNATKGSMYAPGIDFLDYFLELCGGKEYSGFSNSPYGITSIHGADINFPSDIANGINEYGKGYLEYAYKSFHLNVLNASGVIDATIEDTCLQQYGIDITKSPIYWQNPNDEHNGQDGYYDTLMFNTDNCGSRAWYSMIDNAIIPDEKTENMQCKVWEQLYTCINTNMSTDQQLLSFDISNPISSSMFDGLAAEKVSNVLTMRESALKNKLHRTYSTNTITLNDETTRALAADAIITPLKARYGVSSVFNKNTSIERAVLKTNIEAIKQIFYGSIEVATSPRSGSGYTTVASFTKNKAEIFAERMQDSLTYYDSLGINPNADDLNRWIGNIGSRFNIETSNPWILAAVNTIALNHDLQITSLNRSFIRDNYGNKVQYKASINAQPITILDFTNENTSYTVPDIHYKLADRTAITAARFASLQKDCNQDNIDYFLYALNEQLANCRQKEVDSVVAHYQTACTLPSQINDSLEIDYGIAYEHFTLFYYDLAGNLIKTVPPKGVDRLDMDRNDDGTVDHRPSRSDVKNHSLATSYAYNSVGQRIYESTPDGGIKQFWYNNVGQLRFSQNAKQMTEGNYCYLKYDDLGRVVEAGLSTLNATNQDFVDHVEEQSYPNNYNTITYKVKTVFDDAVSGLSYLPSSNLEQHYLQNRVSYSYSDPDPSKTGDEAYTYFSYDPHGNVEWMLQSIPGLSGNKYIAYEYDLVSGKITKTKYNEGLADQFFHRYTYDSDNRLELVETSRNNYLWDTDAHYEYYAYGPLKRISIGEDKIQGLDYVYTINGWLKGMNHQNLDPAFDPGADGSATSSYATDVFGTTLGYFEGDFKRYKDVNSNGTKENFETASAFNTEFSDVNSPYFSATANKQMDWYRNDITATDNTVNYKPLFNGMITNVAYNTKTNTGNFANASLDNKVQGFKYNYDELYRLTQASFDYSSGTDWYRKNNLSFAENNNFKTYNSTYSYDENGNIDTLTRYSYGSTSYGMAATAMDNLYYNYTPNTNKLDHIHEAAGSVSTSICAYDLENQTSANYEYDEIGQLKQDNLENIKHIYWTAAGKVDSVLLDRNANGINEALAIEYDALGNRIRKTTYLENGHVDKKTFYVYDASGSLMAIYDNQGYSGSGATIYLQELPIHAVSKMGEAQPLGIENNVTLADSINTFSRFAGQKLYEINDYLGNVRAVVKDVKTTANAAILNSASDYYPYGMIMPGRDFQSSDYRYGYQGKERDDDLKTNGNSYDFGARLLDPRVGRWLSMDALKEEFPSESPYCAMGNDPVNMIDPDGNAFKFVFAKTTDYETFHKNLKEMEDDNIYFLQLVHLLYLAPNTIYVGSSEDNDEADLGNYTAGLNPDGSRIENNNGTDGSGFVNMRSSTDNKAVIGEELFHAYQQFYYKGNPTDGASVYSKGPKDTETPKHSISREVEAKVARAFFMPIADLAGDNDNALVAFAQDPSVVAVFSDLRNGTSSSVENIKGFNLALATYAKTISDRYDLGVYGAGARNTQYGTKGIKHFTYGSITKYVDTLPTNGELPTQQLGALLNLIQETNNAKK